jgi:hypothetical protein
VESIKFIYKSNELKDMELRFGKSYILKYDFNNPNNTIKFDCAPNSLAISRDDLFIAVPGADLINLYIFRRGNRSPIATIAINAGIRYM